MIGGLWVISYASSWLDYADYWENSGKSFGNLGIGSTANRLCVFLLKRPKSQETLYNWGNLGSKQEAASGVESEYSQATGCLHQLN